MDTKELALRPNCLLTRRPIKIIPGLNSLLLNNKGWQNIETYLFEHGYNTTLIFLPYNNKQLRKSCYMKIHDQLENSHILMNRTTYLEFQSMLNLLTHSTLSILSCKNEVFLNKNISTLVMPQQKSTANFSLHSLFMRLMKNDPGAPNENLLTYSDVIYSKILDRCVELAEIDLCQLDL